MMEHAGLNLENTTDIILLHHSARKEQFIGRAQRIGRTCTLKLCTIYYIPVKFEIIVSSSCLLHILCRSL